MTKEDIINQYVIVTDNEDNLKLNINKTIKLEGISLNDLYIDDTEAVMWVMKKYFYMGNLSVEYIYVIAYDKNNLIKGIYLVSIGDAKGANSYPKEIICFLLLINAKSFILVHNHPNGNAEISKEDFENYKYYLDLSNKINIQLTGSYIITKNKWSSIANRMIYIFDEEEE